MYSKDLEGNQYIISDDQLSWRPSAYGIVIMDNKILLVRENGKYHLPGGGLDFGEDPKNAVIREVREETGITTEDPIIIDVVSSFFSYGANDNPPNLQHVNSLLIYYSCKFVSEDAGDIKLDEYEREAGLSHEWVEVSQLNEITVGTTVDWRPLIAQVVPKYINQR